MADLNDLANFCKDYVKRNQAAYLASAIAKQAAYAIIEDLTMHTPVDVGDALSNWQIGLDSPASTVLPAYAPSPKGRSIKGVWTHRVPPAATALANASKVLTVARALLASKNPGQEIFISNNADYITELNNGSSQQEPALFVERAELVWQYAAQKVLDYVRSYSRIPTGII